MLKAVPNASKESPYVTILLLVLMNDAIIGMLSKNSTLGSYRILMMDLLNLAPCILDEPNILHTDDFYTVLYMYKDLLMIHCKS